MTRALVFDQASKCGWAAWDGQSPTPVCNVHTVAMWGVDNGAMFERFRAWLGRMVDEHQPQLIGVEAPAVSARIDLATIYRQAALHAAISWAAHLIQVPLYSVPNASWRKSFIGFGTRGKRVDVNWKALAVERCLALDVELPTLPKGGYDHNAAEAVGILDHILFTERGVLTPWRKQEHLFLPLPEIRNGKSA